MLLHPVREYYSARTKRKLLSLSMLPYKTEGKQQKKRKDFFVALFYSKNLTNTSFTPFLCSAKTIVVQLPGIRICWEEMEDRQRTRIEFTKQLYASIRNVRSILSNLDHLYPSLRVANFKPVKPTEAEERSDYGVLLFTDSHSRPGCRDGNTRTLVLSYHGSLEYFSDSR